MTNKLNLRTRSRWEKIMEDYIEGFSVPVTHLYQGWKGIKELDLFIPDMNVGIELNGVEYHNSYKQGGKKPISYHKDKSDAALAKIIYACTIYGRVLIKLRTLLLFNELSINVLCYLIK